MANETTQEVAAELEMLAEALHSDINVKPAKLLALAHRLREGDRHLFGFPGDETFQSDIYTVVDRWCDEYMPEPGEELDPDFPSTIEEWSVQPAIGILPDRDSIIENIIERVLDDFGGDSDPFEDAPSNLRVLNAAEELRQAIAATCSWWFAKDVVATHQITTVDDEVHVDGEQFYSKGVRR